MLWNFSRMILFYVYIFEMIDCHIHIYSYTFFVVDWKKDSVRPVNRVNFSITTLCRSYLLLEILITPLICVILISVSTKKKYLHLFNFQHILLSSDMGWNVILSILKNCQLNFLRKFLKIKHFLRGLLLWPSVALWATHASYPRCCR